MYWLIYNFLANILTVWSAFNQTKVFCSAFQTIQLTSLMCGLYLKLFPVRHRVGSSLTERVVCVSRLHFLPCPNRADSAVLMSNSQMQSWIKWIPLCGCVVGVEICQHENRTNSPLDLICEGVTWSWKQIRKKKDFRKRLYFLTIKKGVATL